MKKNQNFTRIIFFVFLNVIPCTSNASRQMSVFDLTLTQQKKVEQLGRYANQGLDRTQGAQEQLYERLIQIRNGQAVEGVRKGSLETNLVLVKLLKRVTSSKNSLDQRAALNRANALIALARLTKRPSEQFSFTQEAYYFYTLLSHVGATDKLKEVAQKNALNLLKRGDVQKSKRADLIQTENMHRDIASSMIQKAGGEEGYAKVLAQDVFGFLGLQGVEQGEMDQLKKLILEDMNNGILKEFAYKLKGVSARSAEEKSAKKYNTPSLELTKEHIQNISDLLQEIYNVTNNTPLLNGRKPVVVFIGRSLAWVYQMHCLMKKNSCPNARFLHVLASGLSQFSIEEDQELAYKDYLISKGFNEFSDDHHELILVDVVETGATLLSIKGLVERCFPDLKNKVQHIAVTYGRDVVDLPCARLLIMPHSLRDILFAKHEEKQAYCPYPTFYPDDWANPEYIEQFIVPAAAKKWQQQMVQWVKS